MFSGSLLIVATPYESYSLCWQKWRSDFLCPLKWHSTQNKDVTSYSILSLLTEIQDQISSMRMREILSLLTEFTISFDRIYGLFWQNLLSLLTEFTVSFGDTVSFDRGLPLRTTSFAQSVRKGVSDRLKYFFSNKSLITTLCCLLGWPSPSDCFEYTFFWFEK